MGCGSGGVWHPDYFVDVVYIIIILQHRLRGLHSDTYAYADLLKELHYEEMDHICVPVCVDIVQETRQHDVDRLSRVADELQATLDAATDSLTRAVQALKGMTAHGMIYARIRTIYERILAH